MRRFAILFLFAVCLFIFGSAFAEAPVYITLNADKLTLEPSESFSLTAAVYPATAPQDVIWTSTNKNAVTVDEYGNIFAKHEGTSYVRAYSVYNNEISERVIVTVEYKPSPDRIKASVSSVELNVSEECSVTHTIYPNNSSKIVSITSSDTTVATVDAFGNIKAVGYGECDVRISSVKKPSVYAKVRVKVNDERLPDRIVVYPSPLSIEPTLSQKLEVLTLPQSKPVELRFESSDTSIAEVSANGTVTAKREGKCSIYVYTSLSRHKYTAVPVTVKYLSTLRSIRPAQNEFALKKGDIVPLVLELSPENASRALTFTSDDENVAYVDENQNIVAARYGSTVIHIASHRNAGVSASVSVTVSDERFPLSMTPNDGNLKLVMRPYDSFNASFEFAPATADTSYTWQTSDANIVSVELGYPLCVSRGVAEVSTVSTYNPDLFVKYTVTVEPDSYTLVMPERRTDEDGISENMQKIENVRASVKTVLQSMLDSGEMQLSEYEKRIEVVDAAFDMYAFPWTVKTLQRYWKAENSEDGAKNFKPGTIYYGLPYTSGTNSNRNFDVRRALEAKRYLPVEGKEYYILNQDDKSFMNMYAGNDCSSFVALSLFGYTKYNGELDKTETLYYDSRLTPFDDPNELRAGDILVRHSTHVFMFLYWADENRTQAVCIEQGGSEAGINTVSTSVYTISDFVNDHYRLRRLRDIDK